jgi:hypothetical protein
MAAGRGPDKEIGLCRTALKTTEIQIPTCWVTLTRAVLT